MQNQPLHSTFNTVKMPPMSPVSPANIPLENRSDVAVKPAEKTKKVYSSRIKTLAEAVILQAVEDLWSKTHRQKSVDFFLGDGFRHYAEIAGMGSAEKNRLMKIVGKSLER